MLAALDVDYRADGSAVAACVLFAHWSDAAPSHTETSRIAEALPYRPGAFFVRELPCLQSVLARVEAPLTAVVVDAYVFLDPSGHRGLGAHLFEALGSAVPVIGVAKTRYRHATMAVPLLRGASTAPLWITAAGIALEEAVAHVAAMHGPHRVPTLLRAVDRLARET
jgi:deoxyribonuclease V